MKLLIKKLGTNILFLVLTILFILLLNYHKTIAIDNSRQPIQGAINNSNSNVIVSDVARQITVRLITNKGAGSGVIFRHEGKIYTIVTCEHIANTNDSNLFIVMTPDGKVYQGHRQYINSLNGIDLAIIKFISSNDYQAVDIETSQAILEGDIVYASGFYNYEYKNLIPIRETFNMGIKPYRLTTGIVSLVLPEQPLPRGYMLGYTNEVDVGMSGGPLLNVRGKLVGINGRGKNVNADLSDYRFADGTLPTINMYEHMKSLSWAIPNAYIEKN